MAAAMKKGVDVLLSPPLLPVDSNLRFVFALDRFVSLLSIQHPLSSLAGAPNFPPYLWRLMANSRNSRGERQKTSEIPTFWRSSVSVPLCPGARERARNMHPDLRLSILAKSSGAGQLKNSLCGEYCSGHVAVSVREDPLPFQDGGLRLCPVAEAVPLTPAGPTRRETVLASTSCTTSSSTDTLTADMKNSRVSVTNGCKRLHAPLHADILHRVEPQVRPRSPPDHGNICLERFCDGSSSCGFLWARVVLQPPAQEHT